MGGIYTLGKQPRTVIRFNRFHDVAGYKYGGWGIYFDEGSSTILAEKNLVYRTTHGGFHQHYGQDNVFRNNIIALGRDWQVQRTRAEDHRSFTFERNIVFWDTGGAITGSWSNFRADFNHNDYFAMGKGELKFGPGSWLDWTQKTMDRDSLISDPHFEHPFKDDFRIKPDSPALKLGFEPFNLDDFGPRK